MTAVVFSDSLHQRISPKIRVGIVIGPVKGQSFVGRSRNLNATLAFDKRHKQGYSVIAHRLYDVHDLSKRRGVSIAAAAISPVLVCDNGFDVMQRVWAVIFIPVRPDSVVLLGERLYG